MCYTQVDVHVDRHEQTDDKAQRLRRPIPPARRPQAVISVPSLPVCPDPLVSNMVGGWTIARPVSARLSDTNCRRAHLISIIGNVNFHIYDHRPICDSN